MKFYSLNKSQLAARIFSALKVSSENDKELTIDRFSDGELLPIFQKSVRYQDLYLICDGNGPDDIMALFLSIDAAKRSGAKTINVIYPYKHTPISNYLFKNLLIVLGATKLITTEIENDAVSGFNTINFGENTENAFAEYINLFDKKFDVDGELFYSLNKSPLANRIFNTIQYYNGTDEYLSITINENGTYTPLFRNNLKGKDVFIVADGHHHNEIMKLLATINTAKLNGARSITVVYPYAPYSRQDKNDHVRSSIGAKMLADILQEAGMTSMMTIELHAGAIQGFYDVPIIEIHGNLITTHYGRSLGLKELTFCAPDQGATKRNQIYAKPFGVLGTDYTLAVIDKRRVKPNEVASMVLIGEVEGRNVVLVDDMGDTMGTICKASKLLKEKKASSTRGVLTHPVFSGNALDNIGNSTLDELIVSDTVAGIEEKVEEYNKAYPNGCKITIRTCAAVLANSIDRLIKHESINEMNAA